MLSSALFWVLTGVAVASCLACLFQFRQITWLKRTSSPKPNAWPSASILKPLAGVDDNLLENLQSHLAIDYPGEWEILLGVRNKRDAAYPIAAAFAEQHFPKVKLFLQEGEPGLNPKVNQLITLTRHARGDILAITDSNVRVNPSYLRDHAAALASETVALASHAFVGADEETFGSAFDNMALVSFCLPAIATGARMNMTQIVGKSMSVKSSALRRIGGWETVKDVLAEDQRFARQLSKIGLKTVILPNFVENVQRTQTVEQHFVRFARWAMIRFRVVPVVLFEPLLNPFIWSFAALLLFPRSWVAWLSAVLVASFSAWHANACARASRGHGFALKYLVATPVRDLLLFLSWLRGATMLTVSWRGNLLRVGHKTRLYPVGDPLHEEEVVEVKAE